MKALYFDILTWKSAIWLKTFRAHIWGLCKAIIFGPKNIIACIKSDWINSLCGECSDLFYSFIIYKALLSHPIWKLHSIGAKLSINVMAGKVYIPDYTIIIQ